MRGVVEKADSDYDTAQLAAWSRASAREWKLRAPHSMGGFGYFYSRNSPQLPTFFTDGLEYDADAIYQLPTLHRKRSPSLPTEYINCALVCQPCVPRERISECENIFAPRSLSVFLSLPI